MRRPAHLPQLCLRPSQERHHLTKFFFSLHPLNVFLDDVDVRFTVAESAARTGSNGSSVASMSGQPRSSILEAFLATGRLVECTPVAYLVTVRTRSRRWWEPGPIRTDGQEVGRIVPKVTRAAHVGLEEDISGLFFVHDARGIPRRASILERVGELEGLIKGRYKRVGLVAMGDEVAAESESPFKTENSHMQEAYHVLARSKARRELRGERFEVLDQFSQAMGVDYQETNGHEYAQVEKFEGGPKLKLAKVAAVLALHKLNHLLIGHSLSEVVQEKGTSSNPFPISFEQSQWTQIKSLHIRFC